MDATKVKRAILAVLTWLEHVCTGLLLVVAAALTVAHLAGWLERGKLVDYWALARGQKMAISLKEHGEWKRLEGEERSRTAVEKEEQKGAKRASEGFNRQRAYWEQQYEKERQILVTINDVLRQREQAFLVGKDQLEKDQLAFRAERDRAEKAANDANLKRALQLYQGMDPELIAEDFRKKWSGTKDEKAEVVELLRRLPPRLSAEVISAIADSTLRVEILNEIRGPGPGGKGS
jgi:hypothetical protein